MCISVPPTAAQRKKPITIKLEPLTDVSQEPHTQQNQSPKSSPDLSDRNSAKPPDHEQVKSPLQRQFSVVKRNAITLPALPQALSQRKADVDKGPKHSNSPEMSPGRKSEGEKKRRFSGSRRAKGRREGKGKDVSSGEPGEQEKTWSPLNKRRAPDTRLVDESDNVENDSGNKSEVSMALSSAKSDLFSNEEQEEEEHADKKPFALKKQDQQMTTKEASANLFFSFKEELLKRATESMVTEGSKLLNGCDHVLSEISNDNDKTKLENHLRGKGDFSENELGSFSDMKEENLVKDNERKYSEGSSSINSDSTKSVGSHKTSASDEIEPSVTPKSVQKLREKFLNINDMIEEKHKNNLAKKSHEIQRELRCISAWKQQTDSHVATSRKLSINSAGKTAELKKPNVGANRRSVKELRKMYMAGGGSEGKAAKGKLLPQSSVSMERKSSGPETSNISSDNAEEKCDTTEPENEDISALDKDFDNSSPTKDVDNSPQSDHDDNSSQFKNVDNNSSQFRDVESVAGLEEHTRKYDRNEPCDDHTVVINVDHIDGKKEGSNVATDNQSPLSSENVGSMSHETRTYTIIKSKDVSNEVPSLHIEPASPESSNGERRTSPGLKRHAASHDSGIDMPSYAHSNLLGSSPDEKIPAGNLKVSAEFSFPGTGTSVLTPSERLPNETDGHPQASDRPLSPGSDSPEVLWSLPLSVGNRASLTDTSSSCSSPRMSVIIAQEASTTKINSRFFTVETMEPWDFEDHCIAEEHQCVMEVEGEFSFGREKSKTSRAERDAIFSLRGDAKSGSFNSTDLIKEEEITLSPSEIDSELQSLEALHRELERRGVEIEHSLRESMDCKYGTIFNFIKKSQHFLFLFCEEWENGIPIILLVAAELTLVAVD